MFENAVNVNQQGNVGLGAAIGYYTSKMYVVSIPLNDNQGYDLIVDKNGILRRIQVKTSKLKKINSYWVELNNNNQYDDLFILLDDGRKFEIPFIDIKHISRTIVIQKKYLKYQLMDQ